MLTISVIDVIYVVIPNVILILWDLTIIDLPLRNLANLFIIYC